MSLRTMFQTDMIPFVFPELNLTGVDTHTRSKNKWNDNNNKKLNIFRIGI